MNFRRKCTYDVGYEKMKGVYVLVEIQAPKTWLYPKPNVFIGLTLASRLDIFNNPENVWSSGYWRLVINKSVCDWHSKEWFSAPVQLVYKSDVLPCHHISVYICNDVFYASWRMTRRYTALSNVSKIFIFQIKQWFCSGRPVQEACK